VARWDVKDYEAVEQNLEGLIANVPDIAIGEIVRRYQSHIVGVSESLSRLLHRVAREVVCYHDVSSMMLFCRRYGLCFLRF
jgi:hypothetical protein